MPTRHARPQAPLLVLALLIIITLILTPRTGAAQSAETADLVSVSLPRQELVPGEANSLVVTVRNTSDETWRPTELGVTLDFLDGENQPLFSIDAADTVQMAPVQPGDLADFSMLAGIPVELPAQVTYLATLFYEDKAVARWEGRETLEVASAVERQRDDEAIGQADPDQAIQTSASGQKVDLVFAMDTSGSMSDEFSALCTTINNVVQDLQSRGINLNYKILGILYTRDCATQAVSEIVPDGLVDQYEDWGPATSDLAKGYTWQPGYVRLIVPVSDEGPQNGGSGCTSDDQVSIDLAVSDAQHANVRVSPVLGTGYTSCTETLGQQLADETGGRLFFSKNPDQDIADGIIQLVGGAVNRSYITVFPLSVPVGSAATVTVTIRDQANQLAVGHEVRLTSSRSQDQFGSAVGTTNAQGQFITTITSQKAGVSSLTATDLTANEPVIGAARVTFGSVTDEPASAPVIVDLSADSILEGLYIQGIGALINDVRVTVDWMGGAPGSVEFILNDTSLATKNATGPVTVQAIDFGKLEIGSNVLRIVARNSVGESVQTRIVTGWQAPRWWTENPTLSTGILEQGQIKLEAKWPGRPVFGVSYEWLLSGKDNTLAIQTGVSIKLPIRGGNWEATISRTATRNYVRGRPHNFSQNIRVLGKDISEVEGKLILGGIVDINGIELKNAGIGFDASFNEIVLYKTSALIALNAFPPHGPAVYQALKEIPLSRDLAEKIAKFTFGFTPRIKGDLVLVSLVPMKYSGRVGVGGDLDATLNMLDGAVVAYIGVEIDPGFSGGSDYGPCFDAAAIGHAGYSASVITWQRSYDAEVELARVSYGYCPAVLNGSLQPQWRATPLHDQPWHIPRGGFGPAYTRLAASTLPQVNVAGLTGAAATAAAQADASLFSNVYGNAKPSMAWAPGGGAAMLVWTHDDPNKSAGQGLEIVSSYYNGTTWSSPINVTSDTYPDTGARVARLSDGRFIAVWERINDPALSPSAPFDATSWSKTDVLASLFDPNTSTWATPVTLHSANSVLDYAPVVDTNDSGAALVAWRHNDGNELVGTDAHPDDLRYAAYDGAAWTEGTVAGGLPSVGTMDLAYHGSGGTLAWTQTITPTGVVTGTQQIFASTFNGSTWSAPQQLTSGTNEHASPRSFYTPSGTAAVAWAEDGSINWRTLTNSTVHLSNITQDVHEFRLARSPAGDLAAVWSEQDDLFFSLYDWDDDMWGEPANLTQNVGQETYLTPVFENDGTLRIGYAFTHITEVPQSTTNAVGESVSYIRKVPGDTDINLLSLSPFSNLTAEELVVTPDSSGTQADVAFTFANNGYFAASNVAVSVFDGDPDSGGVLVDSYSLPYKLTAGASETVTLTHTIDPTGGARTFHAVVDPANLVAEADETDNEIVQQVLGPDLVPDSVLVHYAAGSMVDFETVVRNYGTAASPQATIEYYRNEVTGTPIATGIVPALDPGQETAVLTPWDFGDAAAGEHAFVAVVNRAGTDFTELLLDDNEKAFTLVVGPELAVDPIYFSGAPGSNGVLQMKASVFNFGKIAASSVPVVFYDAAQTPPLEVGRDTISRIEPGDSVEASASWNAPPNEFSLTVIVDPLQSVAEGRRDNNAASLIPGFQVINTPDQISVAPGESATTAVLVRSIGGYGEAVSLEALDLPPEATAELSADVVTPPTTVSLKIDVPATVPETTYPVRIVGTSGDRSATAILNLNVTTLVAPSITAIEPGSVYGSYTVIWSAVSDADQYQVQEQLDGGTWADVVTANQTSVALSGRTAGEWCYRVRTERGGQFSPWSDTACTTVRARPAAPALDEINKSDEEATYLVSWAAISGAASYDLHEQHNGGAWGLIYSGAQTSYLRQEMLPGSWCYRVRAIDNTGLTGEWSERICTKVSEPKPEDTQFSLLLPVIKQQ